MTRKRRVTADFSIRYLSCDGCPAVVPLVGDETSIPGWRWSGMQGGIHRHLCPRCWRQSREGAA